MTNKEAYSTPEEERHENTSRYLENFLNPFGNWDNTISPALRIEHIRNANVNWSVIAFHIQSMEYRNFLKTPYWRAIAAHTKYKAGYRCQVCNSSQRLATHHRNYAIRGYEHSQLQELTVLCDSCHSQFHRKPHGSFQYKFNDQPQNRIHYKSFNQSYSPTRNSFFQLSPYIMVLMTIFSVLLLFYSNGSDTSLSEPFKTKDLKNDVPSTKDSSNINAWEMKFTPRTYEGCEQGNIHKKINQRRKFSR